jgi:acetoin utilization deacetylase AcuC-like enzyme
MRTVVWVAEKGEELRGAAIVMHGADHGFCYLDFIFTAPSQTGRGVGGALYERVREECRALKAKGLFFECLPDEPNEQSDPALTQKGNAARLRFYERYGARPIARTAYAAPIKPGGLDSPYLVFDDLGSGRPLRRNEAKLIVRAILERKYAWLCPPEYITKVVESFKDDPVPLRPPRYVQRPPRAAIKSGVPEDLRILWVANQRHDIHHVRERGYVEAPARVAAIWRELSKLDLFRAMPPKGFPSSHLSAVHDSGFLSYLERVCRTLPAGRSVYPYVFPIRNPARPPTDLAVRAGYYCIDTFTPLNRNAWLAARRAADCTLTCAQAVLGGRHLAYALVRPPGHHAESRVFGGFCYLNSAAIAANYLSAHGKVAMVDIDYHHGNGQQDIFWERGDVLTVSIHGHPRVAYPYFSGFADERGSGEGLRKNINYPLPEKIDGALYRKYLDKALSAVRKHDAKFLVVCLGLDTGRGDPTGSWELDYKDFFENGLRIGCMGLPTLVVQEGGYNTRSLGRHARAFFAGLFQGATGRVMDGSSSSEGRSAAKASAAT